jgi:hypothetical protein
LIITYIKTPIFINAIIHFNIITIIASSIKFINNLFCFSTYMIQKILQTINTKKEIYA